MATPYVTGPAHIYVATGKDMPGNTPSEAGGTALYLGTAEAAPQIEIMAAWEPLMNDIGGSRVPFDYLYQGSEATVVVDLTRWNEAVYLSCAARPNSQDSGLTPGLQAAQDIGTLMASEGMTYDLWVQFPYATKTLMSNNGMKSGYHFWSAFMEGPDSIMPGTRANKRRCVFKCIRYYAPSTGIFTLYDHVLTGLPAVPPTTGGGSTSSS